MTRSAIAEQLRRRPMPGVRTPGEIAEHIVFGRALHLQRALGERMADCGRCSTGTIPAIRRIRPLRSFMG